MPEIVEAEVCAPRLAAMVFQSNRLGAAHIRHQAAQKHHAGSLALKHMVGDCLPVRRAEGARGLGVCRGWISYEIISGPVVVLN